MDLALLFEQKQQHHEAQSVFEYMARHDAHFADIREKMKRNKSGPGARHPFLHVSGAVTGGDQSGRPLGYLLSGCYVLPTIVWRSAL